MLHRVASRAVGDDRRLFHSPIYSWPCEAEALSEACSVLLDQDPRSALRALLQGVGERPVRHLVFLAGVSGSYHVAERHNGESFRPVSIGLKANEAVSLINDRFDDAPLVMWKRQEVSVL